MNRRTFIKSLLASTAIAGVGGFAAGSERVYLTNVDGWSLIGGEFVAWGGDTITDDPNYWLGRSMTEYAAYRERVLSEMP